MFAGNHGTHRFGTILVLVLAMSWEATPAMANEGDHIQPYSKNPYYWQYKGEPVLLLGGSWQDNLFNHPTGLAEHLDLLVACGGNYVRNTMSHRNTGNVYAYVQTDGKYDLDRFNEEYWQRFEDFLRITHARNMIVQIEVFDPWDLFETMRHREGGQGTPSTRPTISTTPLSSLGYQPPLTTPLAALPAPTPSLARYRSLTIIGLYMAIRRRMWIGWFLTRLSIQMLFIASRMKAARSCPSVTTGRTTYISRRKKLIERGMLPTCVETPISERPITIMFMTTWSGSTISMFLRTVG